MTPVERAAAVYRSEPCAHTFRADLEFYLLNGFVCSRPDYFVMGRPVMRHASQDLIVGHYRFPSGACDCWHVALHSGNVARAWDFLPWDLPWVSFERENVLRFHTLRSIRRLSGGRPISSP